MHAIIILGVLVISFGILSYLAIKKNIKNNDKEVVEWKQIDMKVGDTLVCTINAEKGAIITNIGISSDGSYYVKYRIVCSGGFVDYTSECVEPYDKFKRYYTKVTWLKTDKPKNINNNQDK